MRDGTEPGGSPLLLPRRRSRPVTAEQELMLRMVGTAERREQARLRVLELLEEVHFESLASTLADQRLLPLVGHRLDALAPDLLPQRFRQRFEALLFETGHHAALQAAVTLRLVRRLGEAGIRALPLKGPLFADEIYDRAGLRQSGDIDLLVTREDLDRTVSVLQAGGYELLQAQNARDLPLLHHVLRSSNPGMPTLELHWRIHWYETGFSAGVVARSLACPTRGRRPTPADDLAALLLFYLRDGFVGLRYAADIAAWWDTYGEELEPNLLDPLVLAHPELADGLLSSLRVAEVLVGVPYERLTSLPQPATVRSDLGERLADWTVGGSQDQLSANVTFVDWLLARQGGQPAFLRRALFHSRPEIRRMYRLDDDAAVRTLFWQVVHPPKLALRYLVALASISGGRRWAPLPRAAQRRR